MTKQALGKITHAATEAVRHPLGTGIKVVGQAVGLAKGTARAVTGHGDPESSTTGPAPEAPSDPTPPPAPKRAPATRSVSKRAPASKSSATKRPAGPSGPRTAAAGEPPTPADIADNVSPATPGSSTEEPADVPSGDPDRPLSAEELAAGAGTEVVTPVGTRGADVAHNPDTAETDLQQPGTEPLLDPSTTKAVASEAQTLSDAADPDKG